MYKKPPSFIGHSLVSVRHLIDPNIYDCHKIMCINLKKISETKR